MSCPLVLEIIRCFSVSCGQLVNLSDTEGDRVLAKSGSAVNCAQ